MSIYGHAIIHERVTEEDKPKSRPLDNDQLKIAKRIKDDIKKVAPSIISAMNNDKNAVAALQKAIDKSGKNNFKPKYSYSIKEEKPNSIYIYVVDKSIVNAIGDDDKMFLNKYIRKYTYETMNKIYDKLADIEQNLDYGKLSLVEEIDDLDGIIEFSVIW